MKKNEIGNTSKNLVLETAGGEMPDPNAKSKAPSKKEIIATLSKKKPTANLPNKKK